MDINERKFTWEPEDITIYDKNYQKKDFNNYQKQKEQNTTVKETINIGDIVKTKGTGRIVIIKYKDYTINSKFHADYIGTIYGSTSDELILLGSDDIEKIVYHSDVENNQLKTR